MHGIHVSGVEATIATVFDASDPLDRDQARILVRTLPDVFPNLNLQPEDVTFSASDDLYQFNLQIRFFGGKGSAEITAHRLTLAFSGIQLVRDVELVSNIFLGVSHLLREKATRAVSTFGISFPAEIKTGGDRNSYFSSLVIPANGQLPEGLVYYRAEPGFPDQVRVSVERSDDLPQGIFYTWTALFHGVLTGEITGALKTSVTDSLLDLHLEFTESSIVL